MIVFLGVLWKAGKWTVGVDLLEGVMGKTDDSEAPIQMSLCEESVRARRHVARNLVPHSKLQCSCDPDGSDFG